MVTYAGFLQFLRVIQWAKSLEFIQFPNRSLLEFQCPLLQFQSPLIEFQLFDLKLN